MNRRKTKTPQAPEGYSAPSGSGQGFVNSNSQNGSKVQSLKTPSYRQGVLLCVLGGVVTGVFSFLGAALVAYGLVVAIHCKKGQGWFVPVILSLLATAATTYLSSELTNIVTSLVACTLALGVGYAQAKEKLSVGVSSLLVATSALVLLGYDAFLAYIAGSNLSDLAMGVFNGYIAQVNATSPEIQEGLVGARSLYLLFWPISYTGMALLYFVIARFGARVVYKALIRDSQRLSHFQNFDVPFWMCALTVVNLFVYALSSAIVPAQYILQLISMNVFAALRIVFMLQGLAVLTWFVHEKKVSPMLSLALYVLAGMLEVQLGVMALVGLADAWINFRKRNRFEGQGSETTKNNN